MTETIANIDDAINNFKAGATDRVKTAIDRSSKNMGDITEFSKDNVEALVAAGRAAAKGVEELARNVRDYGRTSFETANTISGQLAAAKSPIEFLQIQSDLAKSSVTAFVAEASKFGDTYLRLLGEISKPIKNRYEAATEKIKTVAGV